MSVSSHHGAVRWFHGMAGLTRGNIAGGCMSRHFLAESADTAQLSGGDYAIVGVVAVIALAALAIGYLLLKEVLATGQGTQRMQDIARAVQEGAAAYLNRQRNTLARSEEHTSELQSRFDLV